MPRLYWKDMDSDVGHLSPLGLLILAPLSHWSRLAEQNLNCRLNPATPPPSNPPRPRLPDEEGGQDRKVKQSAGSFCFPSFIFSFCSLSVVITSPLEEEKKHTCDERGKPTRHRRIGGREREGEAVTRAAGLGVDYRTPEEIFLLALKLTVEED